MKYKKPLWLSVYIFAITDLITTYIGLSIGLVEENIVGVFLLDNVGFIGLVIFKLFIIYFCYKLSERLMYGKWNYFTPLVLSIVWLIATSINIFFILKVY